ncbi:Integrase [Methanosarcina sp. MTP4]|uniref:site-specific integrase n=1 Tax=Methanosarcina sp. MTP4 TaxID=1434100 RepID=UPI000615DE63|nr:site-specific integrase [Methanosarcina sp. MTP4]AKB26327.1 Integrase [Methanosarcina sp. MTP4]
MSIYETDRALTAVEKRIKEGKYCKDNKKLFFKFENYLFANGLSNVRVLKYLSHLNVIAGWTDTKFSSMELEDIQSIVARIERSDWAEWTKHDYKLAVKRFFTWLGMEDKIKWIKTSMKKNSSKLPEELLSEAEIKQMIEAAEHPRDKAIIAVLYDTGARIGEMGSLKLKHVVFDQYGAILIVSGKTGMRRVRIIFSVPYLAAWLDIHSHKDNPDAHLWIMIRGRKSGQQLQYAAFRKLIKTVAKKAGIKKRVYNHLFRHSRSTELAQHLTESQLEEHLGWVPGSEMPRIYVHLSGKQIDDALLRIYGIKKEESMIPELTSKKCPRCEKVNGPTSKFCSRCGMAMDFDSLKKVQEYEQGLPKIWKLFLKSDEAIEALENANTN